MSNVKEVNDLYVKLRNKYFNKNEEFYTIQLFIDYKERVALNSKCIFVNEVEGEGYFIEEVNEEFMFLYNKISKNINNFKKIKCMGSTYLKL